MPEELFDIVDDQDRVIGQMARSEVHRRKLFHRAVSIFVFDSRGQLLLQRATTLIKANGGENMTSKEQRAPTDAKGQPEPANGMNAGQQASQAIATREDMQMTLTQAADYINAKINTKNPKPEEVKLLRQALKLFPEIGEKIGNLAEQAKNHMIENISGSTNRKEIASRP